MAKLLRITRAISWIAQALVANRDPNPTMAELTDVINPTVDVFGSDRLGEAFIETLVSPLGAIELVHSEVPGFPLDASLTKHYLSVECFHDDGVNHLLRMGRIVPTATGFPFGGFIRNLSLAAGQTTASRNNILGPEQLMAVQAEAMGVAARLVMTIVWLQYPPGEYTTGVF